MPELPVKTIVCGHNLDVMRDWPDGCMDMACTSPPYWGLRDYGIPPVEWPEVTFCPMPGLSPLTIPAESSVHGLEKNIWAYVAHEVLVFREVWRLLALHGVCFVNLGDSYTSGGRSTHGTRAGYKKESNKGCMPMQHLRPELPDSLKPKDLCGIPWRVAYALQADGWWLRQDIIWHKPNPMPESVTDRCTKAHEYVFLLAKSADYYWDAEAIKEQLAKDTDARYRYGFDGGKRAERDGERDLASYFNGQTVVLPSGRNKRSVWTITTQGTKDAHFATFAPKLVEPMILAGCPREVCTVCGKPRERVTETSGYSRQRWAPGEDQYHTKAKGKHGATSSFTTGDVATKTTVGWTDCGCGAEFRPGRVLDPFGGSGTTGAVAAKLKRDYVLIEMNERYVTDIASVKLQEAETGLPVQEARAGQLGLFGSGSLSFFP